VRPSTPTPIIAGRGRRAGWPGSGCPGRGQEGWRSDGLPGLRRSCRVGCSSCDVGPSSQCRQGSSPRCRPAGAFRGAFDRLFAGFSRTRVEASG
jgi:hypothetical protein